MTLLLASALDVTLLLAAALTALAVLRRHSAALRHTVLATAMAIAALTPALEVALPRWELPIITWDAGSESASEIRLTSGSAPTPAELIAAPPPARAPRSWRQIVSLAWLAGALVTLAGLLTGMMRLARLTARCTPVTVGRWRELADEVSSAHGLRRPVTILQSTHASLLVTCGLLQPKIILPAGAASWPADRCRAVLAHEIAHIRRGDWSTQILTETLRAAYWFNPLVWLACRRLRQESEYACDDAVLRGGIEATAYATHLLDVARHAVGQRAPWAAAPAIAHPSTLERRISAMLTHQRNRTPLTRGARAAVIAGMTLVAVPITALAVGTRAEAVTPAAPRNIALTSALVRPQPPVTVTAAAPRPVSNGRAQQKPGSISGTLYDQLGGRLPGAQVTLTDLDFGVAYNAVTNRDGEFAFRELTPGRYELVTSLPGFANVSNVMPIGPGSEVTRHIVLPLGSLEETVTVGCQPGGAATPLAPRVLESKPAAAPGPGGPVFTGGIGGQIKAPRALSHANPICPNGAFTTDTVVRLAARVGIDGFVSDLRQISSGEQPAAEFVASAMEAVRLWHYTPTLLNGVPVEANMTVTVLYRRM